MFTQPYIFASVLHPPPCQPQRSLSFVLSDESIASAATRFADATYEYDADDATVLTMLALLPEVALSG